MAIDISGKVPAHALESEGVVLGMVLCPMFAEREAAAERAIAILQPQDFYSADSQHIWRAVCDLHRSGVPISPEIVITWLREDGCLSRMFEGERLINELSWGGVEYSRLEAHCKQIKDRSRIRLVSAVCDRIHAECYSPIEDVQSFLDSAESRVADIAKSPDTVTVETAQEIVKTVFTEISAGNNLLGLKTGFRELDALIFGLRPKELVVVAGRPGQGKTSYMLDLASNICCTPRDDGLINGIFLASMEMTREQLIKRAICSNSGVHFERLSSGEMTPDEWSRVTEAAKWLSSLPIWIDDTPGMSPIDIRNKARRIQFEQQKRGKVSLSAIMVDYLQLCNSKAFVKERASREQEIAFTSLSLKDTAKALNVPVVALAQLNRTVDRAKSHRPVLSDLRESGQIEMDADAVIFIHREEYYLREECPDNLKGVAELIVSKARSAKVGTAYTRWIAGLTSFRDDDGEVFDGRQ